MVRIWDTLSHYNQGQQRLSAQYEKRYTGIKGGFKINTVLRDSQTRDLVGQWGKPWTW